MKNILAEIFVKQESTTPTTSKYQSQYNTNKPARYFCLF